MSSFASKTHSKLSQFRSSRAAALENYSSQFQKFSSTAMKEFNTYDNVYHWSHSQAKKFLALMKDCPHNSLAVAHDLRQVYASSAASSLKKSTLTVAVSVDESQNTPEFAENCMGKATFYGFLYKEFDLWYSAFEAEAKEEGGATAATRWVWQTAKKLSKKSGMSMAYLDGVLNTWLVKRLSA